MFPDLQGWYVLPIMLLLGMAGGMAYATIPAFLKVRFNTNEILTSLMLVYVAQLFLDWLVRGHWRNPQGYNFPETVQFNPSAILPEIWMASGRAHWGFILALVAAVLAARAWRDKNNRVAAGLALALSIPNSVLAATFSTAALMGD